MAKDTSLYDILGVNPSASTGEIKKAFRKKAKECHPDTHPGDQRKEEEFKQLAHAHQILISETERARYDSSGETGPIGSIKINEHSMWRFIDEAATS